MQQIITGWTTDDEGDWVALLACGHRRHVHHRPPLFPVPWVLDEVGRSNRIGQTIDCRRCDQGVLPSLGDETAMLTWIDARATDDEWTMDGQTDQWELVVVAEGRLRITSHRVVSIHSLASLSLPPQAPPRRAAGALEESWHRAAFRSCWR